MSVRLRLTLSYALLLTIAGGLLLAVVWVFLLRYVPQEAGWVPGQFFPGRDDLIRAFAPNALLALLALFVLGVGGGWLLAGRMLVPLTKISRATRRVAAGELATRIRMTGPNDEFRELADSFDSMVARIEAHVGEQRRFAANASHELRTPLTITRAMLEVASKDPARAGDALIDHLTEVNGRAIALTEALLLLARSEGRSFAKEPVDLSLLAEEVAETLLPFAERQGVQLEVGGATANANGSAPLLQQLITNLVHNAIAHNLPADGLVLVRTSGPVSAGTVGAPDSKRTVAITVVNTGEPVKRESLELLTEPFQRGTDRVRAGQAGAGLGLAIVRSVTEAHGGTLELTAREGGGLSVTVTLPAAL